MIEYKTKGTCSTKIRFELRDGKVYSTAFENGCDGNLKALGLLVEGMDAGELVAKLKGLRCGKKKTSCADQLATAVAEAAAAVINQQT
ncbi:MAG: TIGR03905 family TSCPD domain-containing protein [Treponema sp.]|nr:TIGR03905 family TSCPD domain-containing protein [Treponema sp.]